MVLIKDFIKEVKNHEIILGVLLLLYLLSGVETPHVLSQYVTTIYGYGILAILTVIIFVGSNPILGILAGISFLELVRRSNNTHPANVMPGHPYSEDVLKNLNKGNETVLAERTVTNVLYDSKNKSLEEEVVENIVTVPKSSDLEAIYKPTLSETHNALSMAEDN